MKVKPKIRITAVIREKCPDNLLPAGNVCPRCGKRRSLSRVVGGDWRHF